MTFQVVKMTNFKNQIKCKTKFLLDSVASLLWIMVLYFLLFSSISAYAQVPPMPAAIGGKVTVDGTELTQSQAAADNYTFKVTRQDGSDFVPPAESSGLNAQNFYRINIPIFDSQSQPGGARSGDRAFIKVYKDGTELNITSPANGQLTVGDEGSTTQIDVEVVSTPITPPQPQAPESIPTMTEWGLIIMSVMFVLSALYMRRRGQI